MSVNTNIPAARKRLARIKCLQDCISSLRDCTPLPEALCYVPSELEYTVAAKTIWKLLDKPHKSAQVVRELTVTPASQIIVNGEDVHNSHGKWLQVLQIKLSPTEEFVEPVSGSEAWLLLFSQGCSPEDVPSALPVQDNTGGNLKSKGTISLKKQVPRIKSWEGVIEETYSPSLKTHRAVIVPANQKAVDKLRMVAQGWTMEQDACLVQLLAQHIPTETENLGTLRGFVESLAVSSFSAGDGESCHLTDDDPSTYWETDGSQGQHWIRLTMRKGTIIKYLAVIVDPSDDNYLPEAMAVVSGDGPDIKMLNSVTINWDNESMTEIKLLSDLTEHHSTIAIRIKACKCRGIDTRIRGIKMDCQEERTAGFDLDFFCGENLLRYPSLQSFSSGQIYQRSLALDRFIQLFDSVIQYLLPSWQSSIACYTTLDKSTLIHLESIRQLLPLSKKRMPFIETLLKVSADTSSSDRKKVIINRHAAREYRGNPSSCSDYSATVFMQLYERLKPRDRSSAPLTYRWASDTSQWWECHFISEYVIDQGGGFRDSLSDLAEELCPSDPDAPMVLPFFIRAPNQLSGDGNINQDCYIPNPSCTDLDKYEWIGQMMGACFRGKEILILPLAPYVWKRLVGESYDWSHDFATVSSAEVRIINNLGLMDRETFNAAGRNWSLLLSDGTLVTLKVDPDGNPLPLLYEDREDYAHKVREIRLAESDKQIKALRSGLLKVVPEAVMGLLSWQELDKRICGEPEITVEALMKNTYYHHVDEDDVRVKYFWIAVLNFTNEERSQLLRFITGRKRLPVSIFISSGRDSPSDPLPESSTCCNTIHLPVYSNEKIAEERLRYAIFNCVSIDTDE